MADLHRVLAVERGVLEVATVRVLLTGRRPKKRGHEAVRVGHDAFEVGGASLGHEGEEGEDLLVGQGGGVEAELLRGLAEEAPVLVGALHEDEHRARPDGQEGPAGASWHRARGAQDDEGALRERRRGRDAVEGFLRDGDEVGEVLVGDPGEGPVRHALLLEEGPEGVLGKQAGAEVGEDGAHCDAARLPGGRAEGEQEAEARICCAGCGEEGFLRESRGALEKGEGEGLYAEESLKGRGKRHSREDRALKTRGRGIAHEGAGAPLRIARTGGPTVRGRPDVDGGEGGGGEDERTMMRAPLLYCEGQRGDSAHPRRARGGGKRGVATSANLRATTPARRPPWSRARRAAARGGGGAREGPLGEADGGHSSSLAEASTTVWQRSL